MTCPKCGLQTQADQKYCRSCGASLRMTTQPLAELATMPEQERPAVVGPKGAAQQRNGFMLWGFIMILIGVAVGVVGKKLLHQEIVAVVGVLMSLLGMFLMVYPHLAPPRRKKSDSGPSLQPEVLTPSRPTQYLPQESNIEFVPSITERTTDLLKTSTAPRPGPKESLESEASINQEKGERQRH
jgi:hypothetical protein